MFEGDHEGDEEAKGAPADLRMRQLVFRFGGISARSIGGTHGSDRLHAQHEGIRRQVSRVGKGVLFPPLPKQIPSAGHVHVVPREISCQPSAIVHLCPRFLRENPDPRKRNVWCQL